MLMLDGAEKSIFMIIKTKIDNKMTCGSDGYQRTKDETKRILNKYQAGKNHTWYTPVKE